MQILVCTLPTTLFSWCLLFVSSQTQGFAYHLNFLYTFHLINCQRLCFSHFLRYEQETPTKEGGGQCAHKERNLALYEQEKLIKESDRQGKLEDKKAIGAPQNQIIPPSHNSSMQQLLNRVMVLQQQKAYHLCGCSIIRSFKPKK